MRNRIPVRRAAFTGIVVGSLDGFAAVLRSVVNGGRDPSIVFKFIAAGIFGKAALSGGAEMVIAGVLLHYLIATGWSILFFVVYARIPCKKKILSSITFGIFVWLVMNMVVIPFSRTPVVSRTFMQALIGVLIIVVTVGLPLAFSYHNWDEKQEGI